MRRREEGREWGGEHRISRRMQHPRPSSAAQGTRGDGTMSLGFGDVRAVIFARVGSVSRKGESWISGLWGVNGR